MHLLECRDLCIVASVSSQKQKLREKCWEKVSLALDVQFLPWEYAGAFYQVDARVA